MDLAIVRSWTLAPCLNCHLIYNNTVANTGRLRTNIVGAVCDNRNIPGETRGSCTKRTLVMQQGGVAQHLQQRVTLVALGLS